jgi:glycine/D-amino acid oxidase-like deaminating enzyme
MSSRRAVIVGGGITGTLTARELLLAGWDVTLLEGAHVGAGSSSRTAAGIRQQFSTPGTVRAMRYSVQSYVAFQTEVEAGTCPIVQRGYLFLYDEAQAWKDAQDRVRMQQGAGLADVEALDQAELLRRFDWVSPTMIGATWCPSDGFLLPDVVYQEAARRIRELGGTLVQNARVTGGRVSNGLLKAVDTPKGRFEADLFIDCTNAWTRRLAAMLGGELLPVDPIKRYLWFVTRDGPLTPAKLKDMPLTIAPSGVYCRPENRDTLMMGWARGSRPDPTFDYEDQDIIEPAYAHDSSIDAIPYDAWMNLAEAIPAIGEFGGIITTTSGYYGVTPDHNPFLGYDPRIDNLIRLVGFSGHGAMFGPFSALVARELADAGHNIPKVSIDGERVDITAFAIGRDLGHEETMVI